MLSTVKIMADALDIWIFTIKPKPMDSDGLITANLDGNDKNESDEEDREK